MTHLFLVLHWREGPHNTETLIFIYLYISVYSITVSVFQCYKAFLSNVVRKIGGIYFYPTYFVKHMAGPFFKQKTLKP